jgi:hypothetical protein
VTKDHDTFAIMIDKYKNYFLYKKMTKSSLFRPGFTLIEALIYIALLGIIIVSFIQVGYQIIEASGRMNKRVNVLEEKNFILKKMEYYLNIMKSVQTPALGNSGRVLDTQTLIGDLTISFDSFKKSILLKKDSSEIFLNNDFISIDDLSFSHLIENGKESISVYIVIQGEEFKLKKSLP